MEFIICLLMGYLIGTINPSYIISKIKGFDIRKTGSGNAGASNALIVLGKAVGIFCALFDIAKACFAIWLTHLLFPSFSLSFVLTGVSCILGHIFPFYMKFRGGKGLACLGGVILMFDWRVFLTLLGIELIVVLLTKYICFVPMTASFLFAALYGVMRRELLGVLLLLGTAVVIVWKHKENIRRIRNGSEARFSMLWNREKEMERLKQNHERSA